jgi:hypothetical protein
MYYLCVTLEDRPSKQAGRRSRISLRQRSLTRWVLGDWDDRE